MFNNFGFGEIIVIGLLGLMIFGPERLPKLAGDAVKVIRQLRSMATTTVNDFKTELGPEMSDLDLRDLHPRRLIEKKLFAEDAADAHDGDRGADEKPIPPRRSSV